MRKRRNQIRDVCETKHVPLVKMKPKMNHIFLDHKHKVLFCTIPKVSGTSWKKKLLAMNSIQTYIHLEKQKNVKHKNINYALKKHKVDTLSYKHLKNALNYTKIMFVREPVERLISAFHDKFNPNQESNHYFKHFGREISVNYYGNGTDRSGVNHRNVTFEQFVKYIVDLHNRNEAYKYDEHWASYNDLCLPCVIDYDIIGNNSISSL